jgi:hypothetical protein
MMTIFIGVSHLLIGMAYMGLGLLSAGEVVHQYRQRGLSRFGLGFAMMAASCGPHHLVHGWCVLNGGAASVPMLTVTLIGLPAGLVFCLLRTEAMLGGRGDRTILATPHAVVAVVIGLLVTVGSLVGWSVATPAVPVPDQAVCTVLGIQYPAAAQSGIDFTSPVVLANLWVTFTYGMVGWYLSDTQIRRYVSTRSWSLSGLALSAVFPTCAAMHLILALSANADPATLPFDLLGVPTSIYFLWIIKRLHMDSVVDWNRHPTLSVVAQPSRSSPWTRSAAARNR